MLQNIIGTTNFTKSQKLTMKMSVCKSYVNHSVYKNLIMV